MGLFVILGNLLLSVIGSILGNRLESLICKLRERRKKEKSPTTPKEGS